MLIAVKNFSRLYRDASNLYRITVDDWFKCRFIAENDLQAIELFLTGNYKNNCSYL